MGLEHRDLALEPEDRAVHHRDAELEGGVVEQVADGEVVGPVDHDVVAGQHVDHVVGPEAHVVGHDVHVRVELGQGLLGRVDLALADAVDVVEDLALQVGLVDHVHVDDADRAHAGRRQVEGGRGAEAARPEQQDPGVEQLELPLDVDLRQQQVALVAVALLGRQLAGRGPVAALVLPLVEAAGHRHDVLVAHVGEGLGREGRAHARGAVDDDRGRLVGDPVLDRALHRAAGDVDGSRDGALLVLVRLPHVEHDGARLAAEVVGGGGVDLADLGLGGGEQLSEARHRAPSRADGRAAA